MSYNKEKILKEAIAMLKGKMIISTQKEISEKMGVNANSISQALKGNERYLTDSFMQKFALTFKELDFEWVTGAKESFSNKETVKEPKTSYSKTEKKQVPYYDIDVTSHITTSFSDVPETPSFFVDYKPFNDCTAYVNNYGDSMYPKYKNGEKLAVRQVFNFDVIMWGETYLVITNENADNYKAVKDIHPHKDESKVILRSSNPAYAGDTVINKEDIISMFAVKGKISQNFI